MNTELIKSVTHCPTCGSECSINVDNETHYYIPKQAQEGLEKLGEKIGESEWDELWEHFIKDTKGDKTYWDYQQFLKENYYPPKPKKK